MAPHTDAKLSDLLILHIRDLRLQRSAIAKIDDQTEAKLIEESTQNNLRRCSLGK